MLRATALPAVVMIVVVLIWMFFGDWHSTQATNTEASQMAASAVDSLYGTSTAQSDSFSLQGGVSGAVPVTGSTSPVTNKEVKFMNATLHTSKGDIKIEFDAATPNTVENFTKLAGSGFYDGTKF